MIAMILLLSVSGIWNKCNAQVKGPVEEGMVFYPDEDPTDLSNNFKLVAGWAEFSNEELRITFKKRKHEKFNEFIFLVDSSYTGILETSPIVVNEKLFWIRPGVRDSGYKFPEIVVLYYTAYEWWVFIFNEDMMFHFKGDVS